MSTGIVPARALLLLVPWLLLPAPVAAAPPGAPPVAPSGELDLTAAPPEPSDPEVRLAGMTYVSSRGERNDMVLDARRARILPEEEVAHLEEVRIRLLGQGEGNLDMTCDRGRFDFESGDFLAEGNVDGLTGDGRRFRTVEVTYRHDGAVVSTDESVLITDASGSYRGGGFRYYLDENRFQMTGGASVVQE